MSLQVCKTEDLPPLDVPVVYTSDLKLHNIWLSVQYNLITLWYIFFNTSLHITN